MESGLRPAAVQLESRQRLFELQLLNLPPGRQAKGLVDAASAIGMRLGGSDWVVG